MKVKNISVSAVVIFGQVLAPQQIGEAPDNHGGVQDLIDLGVLQKVEDVSSVDDNSNESKVYDKYTVDEIKTILRERGIEFAADAKKAELLDLLNTLGK